MALSTEKIRFLSTRRCRHFLAAIAPRLLPAIAATPDPDSTLVNLSKVSDSLGGKGVLWELFSFNPPIAAAVRRAVRVEPVPVGHSDQQPGHDRRADGQPGARQAADARHCWRPTLAELCRGAEDIDPILHSFKNAQQLRVGVRDILGKEDIEATTGALADIAEACLRQITAARIRQAGRQARRADDRRRRARRPAVRVDRAGDGQVRRPRAELPQRPGPDLSLRGRRRARSTPAARRSGETTTNQHFFSELGQRIIKVGQPAGPARPAVRNRPAAAADRQERRAGHVAGRVSPLLRRRAGPALGTPGVVQGARRVRLASSRGGGAASRGRVRLSRPWRPEIADEIRHMRHRLEETARPGNLKRGPGGLVDIEFLVQMLQLKHGGEHPEVRQPATLDALAALEKIGALSHGDFEFFGTSYRVLLAMVSRLRLMNATARHDMPEDTDEQIKLARLLGYPDREKMLIDCEKLTRENRVRFNQIFSRESVGHQV